MGEHAAVVGGDEARPGGRQLDRAAGAAVVVVGDDVTALDADTSAPASISSAVDGAVGLVEHASGT